MARKKEKVVAVAKSGTRITEELADLLAEEAEHGYDLSKARKAGRPSLSGSGVSPRVNFRMTEALHKRAVARAKREGKTVSELAREALEDYVK